MSKLPPQLWDRPFMEKTFEKNFEGLFYDPRHWRVPLKDVKRARIDLLNFSPPEYDILITLPATVVRGGGALYFYEGVIAKEKPAKNERVYGKIRIGGKDIFFVDGYTSRTFLSELLEAWCLGRRRGHMGFIGGFMGVKGKARVEIKEVRPLFKPGEEPTTNYIYRCKGGIKTPRRIGFDVIIKRFLPREPAARGNREYAMAKALPPEIAPRVYGGLVNLDLRVNGEPQVLALFSEFIEGMEFGKEVWDLMDEIARRKEEGRGYREKLERLRRGVRDVIKGVIFPLHEASFELWHSEGRMVKPSSEFYRWYFRELEENLEILGKTGLIFEDERNEFSSVFRRAWESILHDIKATEIHGDLMWRQIIRRRDGGFVVIDLDEHAMGHAGKDIGDICAANRFIAETLPCACRDFARAIAEDLNRFILQVYQGEAKKVKAGWAEKLEESTAIYMAHRHLHDAAYYTPVWREAVGKRKRTYERYINFSVKWLREGVGQLKQILETRVTE